MQHNAFDQLFDNALDSDSKEDTDDELGTVSGIIDAIMASDKEVNGFNFFSFYVQYYCIILELE